METENKNFSVNFKRAYSALHNLHPKSDNEEFKLRYLKVDWFFPNHLNNVLQNIKDFSIKYFPNVDIEVAMFGGLFHDSGLVYKRESSNPEGHEERSIEYATQELSLLGYDHDFIEKVSECIRATELSYKPSSPEATLVRNADAYAHLMSMHFFAKANFANNIHEYIGWFDKKINNTFSKITIDELIRDLEPLVHHYRKMINNYKENLNRDFLSEIS